MPAVFRVMPSPTVVFVVSPPIAGARDCIGRRYIDYAGRRDIDRLRGIDRARRNHNATRQCERNERRWNE